ncbi:MAG: hypothetical protein JXA22_04735 [Candidatus Thermoplasmatota archaeon]|nr:hypothetical protein [Candidatus Thermoplasmatota archaeon]
MRMKTEMEHIFPFLLLLILVSASAPFVIEGERTPLTNGLDRDLLSVTPVPSEIRSPYMERTVEVNWRLSSRMGGNSLLLLDSASIPGDQGEKEQFMIVVLRLEGELSDIIAEFRRPIALNAVAEPYLVPGIVGSGPGEPHPSWKGRIEREVLHDLKVIDMGVELHDEVHYRVYSLRINPVDFFPDGSCIVYEEVTLKYTYHEDTMPCEGPMDTHTNKTLGNLSYLVITHKDLAPSLEKLVKWKSQKGVFAGIVTTEMISSKYKGKDIQAKMRNYIMEMESLHDIDYLLIVGDIEMVRTRNTVNLYPYTPYGEPSTFASDSYFACVDEGTTWDNDGDNYYCEGGELDDALPNMAVGRIASNDKEVISDLVDHLIERERNFTWEEKMEDAVFIAGNPDPVPGYPPDTMDHFWETYGNDVFSGRETIYYDESGTLPFSPASFRETIGNGYQAACYFSHGTQTGLPGLFANNQVPSLSDKGPEGSFFTMACLTGYFDSSGTECFAEAMTETRDGGVIGYIGSSRLAEGDIDTTYSGDAPGLEEDYWRAVRMAARGEIDPTIGDIYREAQAHFSASFYPFPTDYYGYSAQRTFLEYNLFGEPEAPLYFHPPEKLRLEFDLTDDNSTLIAKVTNSSGNGVEGATVTLFRYLELGISGMTNSTGEVIIGIPASNGGIVNITAYRSGDLPVNDTLVLPDALAPTPFYILDPEIPDGFFDTYRTTPLVCLFADEEVIVEYIINGNEPLTHPSEVSFPAGEGFNRIEFRVTDMIGHISEWIMFNFTVDTTPPVLNITTDPVSPNGLEGWYTTPVLINISSSEELAISYYRIDDSVERVYDGPFLLYNGIHDVMIRSYDLAGNGNSTTATIRIDTTTPYSTLEMSHEPDGENDYYRTLPAMVLHAYDLNGASPQYRWDEGPWKDYLSPVYPPKGAHRFEYRAVDRTGNIEDRVNFQYISYDPDPPVMHFNITPSNPDGDNDLYVTKPMIELSVDISEISPFQIRYYLGQMDSGYSLSENSLPYTGPILVSEGEWRLYMMAKDEAGNQHILTPVDLKVDLTRPDLIWNITPTEPDGDNTWYISTPVLSISRTTEIASRYIALDSNDTWMETEDEVPLPPGEHTVLIKAVDLAGNMVISGPFSYKFDDMDPVAFVDLERVTFFVNEVINLSAAASEDENGPLMFMFCNSDGTSSLWVDECNWTFRFNRTGDYTVNVTVKDRSGRTSSSSEVDVMVVERPVHPQYDDLIIEPHDPGPYDEHGWKDEGNNEADLIWGLVLFILFFIIVIFAVITGRRSSVQEIDWEGDDDWMDEDWVDVDIDEEPEM